MPTRRSAAASRRASCAVRRPSAWSRKCPHICASHPRTPIAARRSMPRWPFSSRTKVPLAGIVGEKIDSYVITLDDVENALRPVLAYVESAPRPPRRRIFPRTPRYLSHRPRRLRDVRPDRPHRQHRPRNRFQIWRRACAFSRSIPTATRTSSTHSFFSTPRLRATRCPSFSPASTPIVLTILQPQSIEPDAEMVSSVEVTHVELDEFITLYPRGLRGSARA